jgi:hypothetical protein
MQAFCDLTTYQLVSSSFPLLQNSHCLLVHGQEIQEDFTLQQPFWEKLKNRKNLINLSSHKNKNPDGIVVLLAPSNTYVLHCSHVVKRRDGN